MIYVDQWYFGDPLLSPTASVSSVPDDPDMMFCEFTPDEFQSLLRYEGVVWRLYYTDRANNSRYRSLFPIQEQ